MMRQALLERARVMRQLVPARRTDPVRDPRPFVPRRVRPNEG